jgi:hypothetical protein
MLSGSVISIVVWVVMHIVLRALTNVLEEQSITGQLLLRIYLGNFFFCYRSAKGFSLHKHKSQRGWVTCYSDGLGCVYGYVTDVACDDRPRWSIRV